MPTASDASSRGDWCSTVRAPVEHRSSIDRARLRHRPGGATPGPRRSALATMQCPRPSDRLEGQARAEEMAPAPRRVAGSRGRAYTPEETESAPSSRVGRELALAFPEPMPRTRIFAAVLAFTLSLQLGLAGRGDTCVGRSAGVEPMGMAMQESAMRDVDVSGQPLQASDRHRSASPTARQHSSSGVPCDRSPASTTCQLFASCAAGFVTARASAPIARQDRPERPRMTDVPPLSSRTIAPELPPPRA
jgi:hypothetical protein